MGALRVADATRLTMNNKNLTCNKLDLLKYEENSLIVYFL